METNIVIVFNIRKMYWKFIWHLLRKEGKEDLIITGEIEGKRDKGKIHNLPGDLQ